jgi:acyl-coenzyme A thioesterase PaaI-like protein
MTSDAGPRASSDNPGQNLRTVPEVPQAAAVLASRIRELVESTVHTECSVAELSDAADRIAAITAMLRTKHSPYALMLAPNGNGGHVSINNPVEGPGNPLAPPMVDVAIEHGAVHTRATLSSAYEGPPGRVHGGWVAALLDHAVGRAAALAGLPAMTVSLTVNYRKATPHSVPLDIMARYTRHEGRKVYTTGEILVDGEITAEGSAVLVAVGGLPGSSADQE